MKKKAKTGWVCASCSQVTLATRGVRPYKCTCGSTDWSGMVNVFSRTLAEAAEDYALRMADTDARERRGRDSR